MGEELSPPQAQLARALYDNTAESPQELSFRRGDVLRVLQREGAGGLDGWCLCSLHGQQGIVPANRVKLLPAGPTPMPILSTGAPGHDQEDQEVRAAASPNPSPGQDTPLPLDPVSPLTPCCPRPVPTFSKLMLIFWPTYLSRSLGVRGATPSPTLFCPETSSWNSPTLP